jgi:tRNA(adenine34) deaminase
MSLALEEAEAAYKLDEVPVGAVIVSEDGKIIAKAHNLKESHHNPCGHAEIIAITSASREKESWRLLNCTLYATLEPCLMCMGAIIQARLKTVVFGAYDTKAGAISLGYPIHCDPRLNHQLNVIGGIEHFNCSKILSQFFREKRKKSKGPF